MRATAVKVLSMLVAVVGLAGCQAPAGGPATAPSGMINQSVFVEATLAAHYNNAARARIVDAANRGAQRAPGACAPGSIATDRRDLFPVVAGRNEAGAIKAAWIERFVVRDCPGITHVRVFVLVAAGQISAAPLDRGTGLADPTLVRDVEQTVRPQLPRLLACAAASIPPATTRFDGFTGPPAATLPGREGRPWTETWRYDGCGRVAELTLHFTPDARGTGFRADGPPRIRPL
jgi:hypothetical protein